MTYKNLQQLAQIRNIVLGSGSPRRVQLLGDTGIRFRQVVPDIDEGNCDYNDPFERARELAEVKSLSITNLIESNEVVIGSDTVVVVDGKLIGKPVDEEAARKILNMLSGKRHTVCTALAIASDRELLSSGYELTDVYFNKISTESINVYIRTGEPMDKAGAYGIQGKGAFLVDRIEGSLDNVVGLPRQLLDKLAGEVYSKMKGLKKF